MSELSEEESISETPPRKERKGQAARNSIGTLMTKVVLLPLTAATSVIVARSLGKDDRGIFAFLLLCNGFVLPLLMVGFDVAVVYFISKKEYTVRDIGFTCICNGLLTGAVCSCLMFVLWQNEWLGSVAKLVGAAEMLPILLLLPFQGAELIISRILIGTSNFKFANWLLLISEGFRTALLLLLVGWLSLGLRAAVYIVLASELFRLGWALIGLWRAHCPACRLDFQFLSKAYSYGWKSSLAVLARRVNLRFDQVVLAAVADAGSLGIYSITLKIAELFWLIPDSVGAVMFNKIAAEKDELKRIQLVDQVHRSLILIVGIAATLAAIAGFWILPLILGPDFEGAPLLLCLFLPGIVGLISIKVISKYFGAVGQPLTASLAQVFGVVVSIPLYLLMIPWLGMQGAAIASSLSYFAVALMAVRIYRSRISPTKSSMFRINHHDVIWAIDQVRFGFLSGRVRRPASN